MQQKQETLKNSWNLQTRSLQKIGVLLSLSLLTACGSLKPEPVFINVKPKPAPFNASLSQSMQDDLIEALKKAEQWYKNSGQLLDSVPSTPEL